MFNVQNNQLQPFSFCRESNPADPQSVIDAREKIATILQAWMEHPEKK